MRQAHVLACVVLLFAAHVALAESDAPEFPLPPESFAQVRDSQDNANAARAVEPGVFQLVRHALNNTTKGELTALAETELGLNSLVSESKSGICRGHVVELEGNLVAYGKRTLPKENPYGLAEIYEGRLSSNGETIHFISIERLPSDLRLGERIHLTGVFFKRWLYRDDWAGAESKLELGPWIDVRTGTSPRGRRPPENDGLLSEVWGPLVIVRGVVEEPPPKHADGFERNSTLDIAGAVLCLAVGAVMVVVLIPYMRAKYKRINVFARHKREKANAAGTFPKPGTKPSVFPKPEDKTPTQPRT